MPTKEDALSEAFSAFRGKELGKAEALCRQILREQPTDAEPLYLLARLRASRGDSFEAIRLFKATIYFHPEFIRAYGPLVETCCIAGWFDEAQQYCQAWSIAAPGDPQMLHLTAAVTGNEVPGRCSDDYIRTHFDQFAADFDEVLIGRLGYRGPEIIAAAFLAHGGAMNKQLDVLDAGCGTGLCGPLIRSHCGLLVGVDLSEKMIARAQERGCYDKLVVSELCTYLEEHREAFDAIVAADVLIYFGALERLVSAAAGALRPSGLLIVTTEALLNERAKPHQIQPSGRYSHREPYVLALFAYAGLEIVEATEQTIRLEYGTRTIGNSFVARKAHASALR